MLALYAQAEGTLSGSAAGHMVETALDWLL